MTTVHTCYSSRIRTGITLELQHVRVIQLVYILRENLYELNHQDMLRRTVRSLHRACHPHDGGDKHDSESERIIIIRYCTSTVLYKV